MKGMGSGLVKTHGDAAGAKEASSSTVGICTSFKSGQM